MVAPLGLVRIKLIVLGLTAAPNVAVTGDDTAILVAPAAGVSLVTVGGVALEAAVVNDHVTDPAIGSPAVSLAPLTEAVYVVPDVSAALGVTVSVLVVLL